MCLHVKEGEEEKEERKLGKDIGSRQRGRRKQGRIDCVRSREKEKKNDRESVIREYIKN